jgi:hypothetical protein
MARTIASRMRYAEKEMEPNMTICSEPRRRKDSPIAPGSERASAIARGARYAKALTLAAMTLGYVVVQLDVTIVNVAINSIGADFGGSVANCSGSSTPTPSPSRRSFSPPARSATAWAHGAFSSPALPFLWWLRSPAHSHPDCRC